MFTFIQNFLRGLRIESRKTCSTVLLRLVFFKHGPHYTTFCNKLLKAPLARLTALKFLECQNEDTYVPSHTSLPHKRRLAQPEARCCTASCLGKVPTLLLVSQLEGALLYAFQKLTMHHGLGAAKEVLPQLWFPRHQCCSLHMFWPLGPKLLKQGFSIDCVHINL